MIQPGRALRPLHVFLLFLAGALLGAADADASPPTTDPRWLPWIGCWAPSGTTEDAAGTVRGVQRVCVMPVEGSEGVDVVNIANDGIISRLRLDASGQRHPVDRGGCTGWESARWSAESERIFLRSELTCSGNIARRSSGIIAVVSPSDWVDVQVVSVGDQQSTRILRYRSVADTSAIAKEIAAAVRDRELARQTARLAAASSPTITDVVEASREVEPAVVEAWLLQRMPRFTLDGSSLRRLDDARVPGSVIDLVVTLASPERFGHRLAARGYTFMRIDPPRATTVAIATPRVDAPAADSRVSVGVTIEGREYYGHLQHRHYEGCGHYDLPYLAGIPLALYGIHPYWLRGVYGYGGYGGYGYYPYQPYDPYRPTPPAPNRGPVIELPDRRPTRPAPQPDPDPATRPAGGRVINGRGYTRPPEPETARATSPSAASAPRAEVPRPEPARTAVPRSAPPPAASSSGTSRGQASTPPAAQRAPETKPAATETRPAPAAEPRTAKRRPPPGA